MIGITFASSRLVDQMRVVRSSSSPGSAIGPEPLDEPTSVDFAAPDVTQTTPRGLEIALTKD